MNKKQERQMWKIGSYMVGCIWFAAAYFLIYFGAKFNQGYILFVAAVVMWFFWNFDPLEYDRR